MISKCPCWDASIRKTIFCAPRSKGNFTISKYVFSGNRKTAFGSWGPNWRKRQILHYSFHLWFPGSLHLQLQLYLEMHTLELSSLYCFWLQLKQSDPKANLWFPNVHFEMQALEMLSRNYLQSQLKPHDPKVTEQN